MRQEYTMTDENFRTSAVGAVFLRVGTLKSRMLDLEERILRLSAEQERMTKVLSLTGGCGSGGNSSRLEELTAEKAGLEETYRSCSAAYTDAVHTAYRLIDTLENERERRILTYFYIDGMTSAEIGKTLDLSASRVRKLRLSTLRALLEREMSLRHKGSPADSTLPAGTHTGAR